ncbi:SSU ribosomal protein S12P methylthiotransferase [Anaerobacterium chartisolvens]|uniref:Ribosomal protein uS12 methylthiotransferase RimO n=1 Tax=Anaerobacterium chartisolvens TaxID=1297424 RepID=A0A369BHG1_9FIRM|nr:30S ribosomal protein S12 methylthiotransferase RimO [Anaerobacterium chartisolvens]RCX20018.1 SSU ribosomal protein S12P methylthiotransferase [Anaerobacterium chartisolvens]
MKRKIGIVSLGCPKNLVDSEIMLGLLKSCDYEITNDEAAAEIIIVNTCGFIESAKQESVNAILEMAGHKAGKCELLIVTGCMAERYKGKIIEEIPEVDAVVGTGSYSDIARIIEEVYAEGKRVVCGGLHGTDYLENSRVVSTNKGYAYIKIAEGCDNCCTYCIIPSLRGAYRSRRLEDIIKEAEILAAGGVQEVILVAQDTTRYGTDIYGRKRLSELIRSISGIDGIKWIRLLYCYPEEIDEQLIDEIAINKKVCKYMDIPIQHASDKILRLMGRRGTREELGRVISGIRERIPGVVIRTSLIVGFPGETEEDFSELFEFVNEYRFDRLGVFTYSKEEDTPAAAFEQQVPKRIKQRRHDKIMELQKGITLTHNAARVGSVCHAIVEGVADDGIFYLGRTFGEAPEIDGTVYFTSPEPLDAGQLVKIKILDASHYDLIGEVVNESAQ